MSSGSKNLFRKCSLNYKQINLISEPSPLFGNKSPTASQSVRSAYIFLLFCGKPSLVIILKNVNYFNAVLQFYDERGLP